MESVKEGAKEKLLHFPNERSEEMQSMVYHSLRIQFEAPVHLCRPADCQQTIV